MRPFSQSALRAAILLLFTSVGFAQTRPVFEQPTSAVMELLVREPAATRLAANLLADRGAVEAIPLLETKFADIKIPSPPEILTSDAVVDKSIIASALVRLGDKKTEYWEFLAAQAEIVANDRTPFPIQFDDK